MAPPLIHYFMSAIELFVMCYFFDEHINAAFAIKDDLELEFSRGESVKRILIGAVITVAITVEMMLNHYFRLILLVNFHDRCFGAGRKLCGVSHCKPEQF